MKMKVLIAIPKYETGTELTVPRTAALLAAVLEKYGHKVSIFDSNVSFQTRWPNAADISVCTIPAHNTTSVWGTGSSFPSSLIRYRFAAFTHATSVI